MANINQISVQGTSYEVEDANARATITTAEGNITTLQNKVSELETYSTTETNTGKTWIDGKPIYRICFYSATNWGNDTIVGTIQNMKIVIDICSISRASPSQNWYRNYTDSSEVNIAKINDLTKSVSVYRSGSFINNYPALVIVEYTKTTD